MGKIKASIEAAAYKVAPKSVKKKMDKTLAYKNSKNMAAYYDGATMGFAEKADLDSASTFYSGSNQEYFSGARSAIPRKKARKIDSSRSMQKEISDSYSAGKQFAAEEAEKGRRHYGLNSQQFGK